MERSSLMSVCNQVYRKFPEMNGVQPKVTARPDQQFLLVFKTMVAVADGRSLPRAVRVVASADGKILKMTTSH